MTCRLPPRGERPHHRMTSRNTAAADPAVRPDGRWLVLTAVSLGLLLATLDTSILYIAVPPLTVDLGATTSESLWIINTYPLEMTGLLLGTGTLGDRYGHKRVFQYGIVLFGVASLVAAFSPSPGVLIFARGLLAVGAALMLPATLAIIRVTFGDEKERNFAIAVWSSVSIGGIAFGPLVGGLLLEWFWWGSVFLINVPIVIATFVLTGLYAPKAQESGAVPWDLLSSLLALAGLTGMVAAIKEVTLPDPSAVLLVGAILVSAVSFTLFARRQARLKTPLLDFRIFSNRGVSAGVVAAGLSTFVFAGVGAVTSQHFQTAEGYSPLHSGLLVGCIAAGATVTSLLSGSLLSRIGPRPMLLGGAGLAAVGYAAGVLVLPVSLGVFAISLVAAGSGIGVLITVASSTIITNVSPERAGMASGVEEVAYEFGSLLSVTLLGSAYASMALTPFGIESSYRTILLMGVTAAVLGLISIAWLLPSRASAVAGNGH
ncbi:MFS transporter [Brevibacterium luteolum]|uniref:MFS transporter n=2 Tax=Brevibacterium luteolum TaxID=199591 RepID=A0A2N6PGT1_9MICO|nr:MFS transporter [Brevibacterium luteolum]